MIPSATMSYDFSCVYMWNHSVRFASPSSQKQLNLMFEVNKFPRLREGISIGMDENEMRKLIFVSCQKNWPLFSRMTLRSGAGSGQYIIYVREIRFVYVCAESVFNENLTWLWQLCCCCLPCVDGLTRLLRMELSHICSVLFCATCSLHYKFALYLRGKLTFERCEK